MSETIITPTEITDLNRDKAQLEVFWIFCILVAGKNSDQTAHVVTKLLQKGKEAPFEHFKYLGEYGVRNALVASRTGQYDRITRAIMESVNLDMTTCTFEDLMAIYGVGPKTAQFFLVHSRKGYEGVILDTHILKYLSDKYIPNVPKSTPSNMEKYNALSKQFLYLSALDYPLLSAAQRDLLIWTKYSGRDISAPLSTI